MLQQSSSIKKSIIMKKSIILGIALIASLNVVSAANKNFNPSVTALQVNVENNAAELGFISFADPTLIATELGSLKKAQLTIDETIAADSKIIEGSIPAKTPLLKSKKKANKVTVKLASKLAN